MELEGCFVVEDGHVVLAYGPEFTGKIFEESGSVGGEVKHNVVYVCFNGAFLGAQLGWRSFERVVRNEALVRLSRGLVRLRFAAARRKRGEEQESQDEGLHGVASPLA
jgi:hypothetical protein